MEELIEIFGLTDNEVKVYKALLKIKKGTKTPIVRESKVLSSKVYEVLDRLIQKGLVASFVENNVKHYVPVHPTNVSSLFDNKIDELKEKKKLFEKKTKELFPENDEFISDVQLFRGWKGMESVFNILVDDLHKGDTYHVLGATPGENFDKAVEFFSKTDKRIYSKNSNIKMIAHLDRKKESKWYMEKYSNKKFLARFFDLVDPFEIGMTNNFIAFILLEKNPTIILVKNKKIRNSFIKYFNTIWKQAKS